jgi:hypothetical protein
MATTRNTRASRQRNNASFGLLANGSSGPWDVAIDEAISGPDRWWAQIEGRSVTFSFEIASPDIVGKMVRFLQRRRLPAKEPPTLSIERNGSLVISKDKKIPITLVRDDEYDDRFFFVVGPMDSPTVRFVIAGSDVVKIADALRQVKEDLEEE